MKLTIAFVTLCFIGMSYAAPQTRDGDAYIVKLEQDNIGVGPFSYSYETSNGIAAAAKGDIENDGTPEGSLRIVGQYQYIAPDGQLIRITYIADKDGFRAEGAHLPKAQ